MNTDRAQAPLPALRQDLEILPAAPSWSGAPTFLIIDRVTNRYFRIGKPMLELLSAWRGLPIGTLMERLRFRLRRPVSQEEIEAAAQFMVQNGLSDSRQGSDWRRLHDVWANRQERWWKKLVHRYIFFRVPLVRPQPFLDALWPYVRPLFSRSFAVLCASIAIFSLLLVSRQWDAYIATFVDFISLEGFALYLASLVFIKALHELGHAFMAKKYGVEVPVIGAAFIVLMPILYTDTTGAYRLRSRRQRLNIDLAGIYVELVLASLATLLWVFLPDGPLRSVAFATATLSWVMSLAVNLNPFMRFDGYYILSDLTGFENLQARGFALGKWRLRELLFGLKEPAPELLPRAHRRWIVLHAWGTWIYRFFLFLGIALLVYAFFIKLVGIFLFVVEILWFIGLPVWREVKAWWDRRNKIIASPRSLVSFGFALCLLALFFLPWSTTVQVPSVMRHSGSLALHSLQAGQVVDFDRREGGFVRAGERIIALTSPELEENIVAAWAELALVEARLARSVADVEDRSLRLVLEEERFALKSKLAGYRAQRAMLDIRAPFDGVLVDLDPFLGAGMWLAPKNRIATLLPAGESGKVTASTLELRGMVAEAALGRIDSGARGNFMPDERSLPKLPVKIEGLQRISAAAVDEPLLAEAHGGSVATVADPKTGEPVPNGAWFPVRMAIDGASQIERDFLTQTIRGIARIEAAPQSLAERIFKRVASVLVRELSF